MEILSAPFEHRKIKLSGRKVLYSNEEEITAENVVKVLNKVLPDFAKNQREIDYLYRYYRGRQPVDHRVKKFRPDIKNTVVENHAYEIVSFKTGYGFSEPVQYVRRAAVKATEEKENSDVTDKVMRLNELMAYENKSVKDKDIAESFNVCGTAYRMVLPKKYDDECPFEIDTLNARETAVVYSKAFGKHSLMSIQEVVENEKELHYYIYTPTLYFHIYEDEIISQKPNTLGYIPIIEYPANNSRLGSFETVIEILDAINTVNSNRLDGVEQFVQFFMKFINTNIDENDYLRFLELGAIKVKSEPGCPADVGIVSAELNQDQVQTLVDYLYQTALIICGMPNRNAGNRSTSDTGQGVVLRDGWANAESSQRNTEDVFKISEKQFLKVVKNILKTMGTLDFNISDIDIKFSRNKTDNFQTKAQVLQSLLESGIHPQIAISVCELFGDSPQVYADSKPYLDNKWLTVDAQNAKDEKAKEAEEAKNKLIPENSENYTPSNNKTVE